MEEDLLFQQTSSRKRLRPSSDSEKPELDTSPQVKRLREDLLDLLDDTDLDPVSQDLASVMKSFEEELSTPPPPVTVIDLTSDSGDSSPPELGFLLGASDDDLGLPPSSSSTASVDENDVTELLRPPYDSSEFGGLWGLDSFDEQIPGYGDSFELGPCDVVSYEDALFQYEEGYFAGAGDFTDFSWRTE